MGAVEISAGREVGLFSKLRVWVWRGLKEKFYCASATANF